MLSHTKLQGRYRAVLEEAASLASVVQQLEPTWTSTLPDRPAAPSHVTSVGPPPSVVSHVPLLSTLPPAGGIIYDDEDSDGSGQDVRQPPAADPYQATMPTAAEDSKDEGPTT